MSKEIDERIWLEIAKHFEYKDLTAMKKDLQKKGRMGYFSFAIVAIKETRQDCIKEIRKVVADYMQSEGCSCCQDIDQHKINNEKLAKLLVVPKYSDGNGYNFNRFSTKPTRFVGDEVEPEKEVLK